MTDEKDEEKDEIINKPLLARAKNLINRLESAKVYNYEDATYLKKQIQE